jgi:sporulation protein YlmC with PRC-barrel domain
MQRNQMMALVLTASLVAATALSSSAMAQTYTSAGPTSGEGKGSGAPTITNTAPTNDSGVGAAGMAPPGTLNREDGRHDSGISNVMTDYGNIRVSKVLGSAVYNEHDQKVGSVQDILLGKTDQPILVILSVGGFLGIDSRLVAVPYNALLFGNTHDNADNKVLLPGATKASIAALPAYRYAPNS